MQFKKLNILVIIICSIRMRPQIEHALRNRPNERTFSTLVIITLYFMVNFLNICSEYYVEV